MPDKIYATSHDGSHAILGVNGDIKIVFGGSMKRIQCLDMVAMFI